MSNARIKVLQFICPTGFYGAERWILALSKNLPSEKVDCELVVTVEHNSKNLDLVKQFKVIGGTTFELPMQHKFDLTIIAKLVTLIKKRQIDIIHTHGYKSDILGVLAAKMAGIKCVVTPHGFENVKDRKLKLFIWLGCQSMRYAHKVAPLSKQLCEDVQRFGVKKNNLVYIQNGVDLSEVEQQLKVSFIKSDNIKTIGFVGQMISRKNIKHILDIFDNLYQKHSNISLTLLGDGDERVAAEQYSQSLSSAKQISFLGFRNDRLAQLQQFDLFVMTSSLEGIPRCLMETMAMEVPIAAYNISGVDQLISHEKTGLLASYGDKENLELHWQKLLFEPEYAEKIALNAKEYVYKHYSAKRMAEQYTTLFKELMMD